ncbi:hypothetical protein D3C78_816850 [compost metagenome]
MLPDVIFLRGDFLAFAVAVLLVGRRGEGDVTARVDCDIAGCFDAAGHGVEITSGIDVEITPGAHVAHELGGGLVVVATVGAAVIELDAGQADVTAGVQGQVAAAGQAAAEVIDVAPSTDVEVVGSLDACGTVGETLGPGAVANAAFMDSHAAFVDDIARQRGEADITTGDDAALGVLNAVAGEQVQATTGLDQTAVVEIGGASSKVATGAQGALVGEVTAGDQRDVIAHDQGAIGCQSVVGLSQVEHRHQHLLAVHFGFFEPDDVMGQRGDLFGGQGDAQGELEAVLVGDGVVHQVLEQGFVAGHAVDVTLAGASHHGLLDQALFVETIAQAFLRLVRIVAELTEQVVRAKEALEAGEGRVGLDQVLMAVARRGAAGQALNTGHTQPSAGLRIGSGRGVTHSNISGTAHTTTQRLLALRSADALPGKAEFTCALHAVGAATGTALAAEAEQAVLPLGQVEARQRNRVDLLLRQIRRELLVDGDDAGRFATDLGGADAGVAHHLSNTFADDAVGQVLRGIDGHLAASLHHRVGKGGRR